MRCFVVVAAIGSIALADAPLATAQSASTLNLGAAQVIANLEARNATFRTLRATFTQQYLANAYNATQRSNGSVLISGPRVDWSYSTPAGNRIVSNGTRECIYDAASTTLVMQDAQSPYAVMPLLFAQTNFAASFSVTVLAGTALQAPMAYVVVLTPNTSAYTKILLFVDQQTFDIERVMFLDGQQNRNKFDFTNVQRNVPNVNAAFVMYPPLNAKLIVPKGKPGFAPPTCP